MPSEAALELYEGLGPAFTDLDSNGNLLGLCEALVSGNVDRIHELVVDVEGRPGWQVLFDPTRCPSVFLPWLAQVVGAVLLPEMSVAEQREAIKQPVAFRRGTIAAIESTARRHLTGTQTVLVDERYEGGAWKLRVRTLKGETPEPERTKAEIVAEQKPIGIVLTFEVVETWDWGEVRVYYATWKLAREAFATWKEFRTRHPGP